AFAELAEYQRHFAARQAGLLIDVLTRGLGYRGIYLAGVDDLDTASEILAMAEELQSRDWRDSCAEYREADGTRPLRAGPPGGFCLFAEGEGGLLTDGPFEVADRAGYASGPEPSPGCPKGLANGPCAGADVKGMCEVHADRRCHWGRVLEAALASAGAAELMALELPPPVPPESASPWRDRGPGPLPVRLDIGSPEGAMPTGSGT
ncbi:MAG: methylenetetrahydrofolate reductase C-terminal domain-containing protein, partial [Gemmatimonadota bacterium]